MVLRVHEVFPEHLVCQERKVMMVLRVVLVRKESLDQKVVED